MFVPHTAVQNVKINSMEDRGVEKAHQEVMHMAFHSLPVFKTKPRIGDITVPTFLREIESKL